MMYYRKRRTPRTKPTMEGFVPTSLYREYTGSGTKWTFGRREIYIPNAPSEELKALEKALVELLDLG